MSLVVMKVHPLTIHLISGSLDAMFLFEGVRSLNSDVISVDLVSDVIYLGCIGIRH